MWKENSHDRSGWKFGEAQRWRGKSAQKQLPTPPISSSPFFLAAFPSTNQPHQYPTLER